MEIVLAILGTLGALGLVAYLVMRAEIRKENRPPRRRGAHDDAYGKDPLFSPQGDTLPSGGRRGGFGDSSGGGGSDAGGGGPD